MGTALDDNHGNPSSRTGRHEPAHADPTILGSMTWKDAVLLALSRLAKRRSSRIVTRQKILEEELDQIISDTQTDGRTPGQTLNRTLQDLRDEGMLSFLDNKGTYGLLFLGNPDPVDIASDYDPPPRDPATIHRIRRDTRIVAHLKQQYEYRCQICGHRVELKDGYYCEAHHLRPLGQPHNGPDVPENIIIVCPNHHVQLDYGALKLNLNELLHLEHALGQSFIDYHNNEVCS